jgi:glycosyltransferase involved in cell wall biosynthesis
MKIPLLPNFFRRINKIFAEYSFKNTNLNPKDHWKIYHSPFNELPPVAQTKSAIRIITIHDCIHIKYPALFPWGIPPIKKIIDSIHPESDYVICDSICTKNDLVSVLPISDTRIKVIYLAADPVFSKPIKTGYSHLLQNNSIQKNRYILALGQTELRKNLARQMKAFNDLQKSDSSFSKFDFLVVLNNKKDLKKFSSILKYENLMNSNIKFIRDVDNKKLSFLYYNACFFSYISLYEGFGIPPLEAMSSGCPVVVSNVASLPEVVGDAGLYVDNPENINEIANAYRKLLNSDTLRDEFSGKGIIQAKKFSWDKTINETSNFYSQVL